MPSAIYEIQCTVSGKAYVGSWTNPRRRFATHRWMLRTGRHYNPHLQRAWDKYGEEAFDFAVVETCPEPVQFKSEQRRFGHRPWNQLYNIARVARKGGTREGIPYKEATKKKIRGALRGKPSWNKGSSCTWIDKVVESRVSKYDFLVEVRHKDGRVEHFTHIAAAERHFGYTTGRVKAALRKGHRLTTGWKFQKVEKGAIHADF